jgi:hypothetical protein
MQERGGLHGLWHHHPWLVLAFLLAASLSTFLAGRIVVRSVYWATHREQAVAPWMTVGYVGRSWGLDPREIDRRAGLPPPDGRPLTLEDIARQTGRPVDEIVALVTETVATMQAETAPSGTSAPGRPAP